MIVAAKVLAASAVDVLARPDIVAAAKDELQKATKGKPYQNPLTAEAKPAVF